MANRSSTKTERYTQNLPDLPRNLANSKLFLFFHYEVKHMIDKKKLVSGVVNMLKVNMGLKGGEKVVVVSDVPTMEEWKAKDSAKLTEALERSLLAKMVSEVAAEKFSDNKVEFFVYPSVGKHGTYPGKEVEEKMKNSKVAIAITTYSLTHTDALVNACKAGARVASMPMFVAEMSRWTDGLRLP